MLNMFNFNNEINVFFSLRDFLCKCVLLVTVFYFEINCTYALNHRLYPVTRMAPLTFSLFYRLLTWQLL